MCKSSHWDIRLTSQQVVWIAFIEKMKSWTTMRLGNGAAPKGRLITQDIMKELLLG